MSTTEEQQRYLTKRREKARDFLGGKCVACGSTDDLHFDRIDPATKVIEIGNAIAKHWSWVKLVTELVKCQLLCGAHHREKPAHEASVEHGGGASGRRNCPCAPCRAKKAEYMASYVRPHKRV